MHGHHSHHSHDDHDGHGSHDHHAQAGKAHRHAGHGSHGGHGGHAGHSHGPINYDRVFAIGIALNVTYALIEAIAGLWLNSLALLADAGHNLSDVLGLVLAWVAVWLSRKRPTATHSYGLGRSSILAALANAMLLLVALGAIVWEAITRLSHPAPIETGPVAWIATIGIMINAFTAWLFMRGSKTDLNVRGAYLHMVADAAVSLGVVVSALLMRATGWLWLDPLTSLVIAAVIALGSWRLLIDSLRLSLDAVPRHIDAQAIARHLTGDANVKALHDLHIWALSTEAVALTAHLVCPGGHPGDAWLQKLCDELHDRFGIDHPTLQIETGVSMPCATRDDCGLVHAG